MKGCRNPSPPFTTLHSSGTQRNNAVALAFVGVLRRAAEYFQCLSDFHLQTCCHHDCRILFGDFVADIIHPHPFAALFVYRRYAHACREHCLKVVGLEIRGVGLLDALNFIGIEPIGRFRLSDFVQCLCVELTIVQCATIDRNHTAHQPIVSVVMPGMRLKSPAMWFCPSHLGKVSRKSQTGLYLFTAFDMTYSLMSCRGDLSSPIPCFFASRTMEFSASSVKIVHSSQYMARYSVLPLTTFLRNSKFSSR